MKKRMSVLGILTLCMSLMTPAAVMAETTDDGSQMHKIGVIVYSITDSEVISFRDYLEKYIELCFPDVDFIYSDKILSAEEEQEFIQNACDAGAEGFLSFNPLDLEAEVELCEENEAYYMIPATSITEEEFDKVADNPYFVGAVGPGVENEYQVGVDMADYFIDLNDSDEYFILAGGSATNNIEQHMQRTMGILDELQKAYGADFGEESRDLILSSSEEPVELEDGDLKVCVVSGLMDEDDKVEIAEDAYEEHPYENVLSVSPISGMKSAVSGASVGVVDCYSSDNLLEFTAGNLSYVVGKYSSIIGPSFAALYNAITGYADDMKTSDGKAFQMTQGYWVSTDADDYTDKYALSSSVSLNAYSADDLMQVCKVYNSDATLDDLEDLISAYTFEDAMARRNQNYK